MVGVGVVVYRECMPPRRKTGPQALDDDKIHRITYALERGSSRMDAAAFGRISSVTFYAWLNRGEADIEAGRDSQHAKFANAVQEAEAKIALDMVEAWSRGARKDWRAARDWLARRRPDDWAPIVEAPVAVTINAQAVLTDDKAVDLARQLRDQIAKGATPPEPDS